MNLCIVPSTEARCCNESNHTYTYLGAVYLSFIGRPSFKADLCTRDAEESVYSTRQSVNMNAGYCAGDSLADKMFAALRK